MQSQAIQTFRTDRFAANTRSSRWQCLASLTVALVACVGMSSAQSADKTIVAIYKNGTQQYFLDQAMGFTDAAKSLGYKARIINVEMDASQAITAVGDAIASGAKGIAITAPEQAIGPAVANAASKAKVPLVATDDMLVDAAKEPIPFVGFDGTAMGDRVGDKAAQLFKQANVKDYGILSVEIATLSACNDRTNAAKAKLQAAGANKANFFTVPYDGTTTKAIEAAGPVISAHPGVNNWFVVGCNDEGVAGAVNALSSAGFNPKQIYAVGLGATEACRPWNANKPSGFKAALYISGRDVGLAAAKALIANIDKGTPLPPKTVANTIIVDPTNWKTVMGKCN